MYKPAQLLLLFLVGLSVLYWRFTPLHSEPIITYSFDGESPFNAPHGTFIDSRGDVFTATVAFSLPTTRYPEFFLKVDDCLESLIVNNEIVQEIDVPYCDYSSTGRKYNLREYLQKGDNTFILRVQDHGGEAGVRIMHTSLTRSLITMILLLLVSGAGLWLLGIPLWGRKIHVSVLCILLLLGIGLRLWYGLETPYYERGHDTDAHIEYIDFVRDHGSIPPANEGWEFHQAPLYYFFTAGIAETAEAMGANEKTQILMIQLFSVLASICTLIIAIPLSRRIFHEEFPHWKHVLFLGLLAVFPSWILLSSRITNNTLYLFIAALSTLTVTQWWQQDRARYWYYSCIIVSLAFLTKISGLLLIASLGVLWIMRIVQRHRRFQWKHSIAGILLLIILTAWYPFLRFHEGSTEKVTSIGNNGMSDTLSVENTLENFTTFSIKGLMQYPFNHAHIDENRRMYFWEYFYRSAFFGEFDHEASMKPLARTILLCGLLSMLIVCIGLGSAIYQKHIMDSPLYILGAFLLLGALLYRFAFSYAPNQDFRQSVLLVIPLSYFYVRGLSTCFQIRKLRSVGYFFLCTTSILMVGCAIWIIWVAG